MELSEGGCITAKKPHACGGSVWKILRLGADVKLKCEKCGRIVFFDYDRVKKITRSYQSGEINAKNQG